MRSKDKVIAILGSDLHLSHKCPAVRMAEPSWYNAMKRVCVELRELSVRHGNCPIIVAGDIFDRWNSPPELINWALRHMPKIWAVPGQHDLAYHRLAGIRKTAYWTLVEAKIIRHLDRPKAVGEDNLIAYPCAWGQEIKKLNPSRGNVVHLLVAHQYIWANSSNSFKGAPTANKVSSMRNLLSGYTAAVFGDNHKGFLTDAGNCHVLNGGTMMRRKADEITYRPHVGLLYSDGSIDLHYLNTSADKFLDNKSIAERLEAHLDATDLLDDLRGLSEKDEMDFEDAVRNYIKSNPRLSPKVHQILLSILDSVK